MTGSDEVFEAAFRRAGILRVASIGELFDMAEVLSKQPRTHGPRLAIVTNAGGGGVLAVDALLANGGQLATLSDSTKEKLNELLPAAWSHAQSRGYAGRLPSRNVCQGATGVADDPGCDAVLSILAPQGMTEPEQAAGLVRKAAETIKKPLIASWMGGSRMQLAANVLNEARIPTFEYPDAAARSFSYMWRYTSYLQALYETPVFAGDLPEDGPRRVAEIIASAVAKNRTVLTEHESKQVLAAYELPVTLSKLAASAEEAVAAAETIGYPVVLKLNSETVTHKSDRGGVHLGLKDASAVRTAFEQIQSIFGSDGTSRELRPADGQHVWIELILGSSTDPQFGPVLVFGLGGQLVEVCATMRTPCRHFTTTLARRMMENTRISQALKGVRGRKPVDLEKLEELLVRFSELVVENPRIADIEINPLLASDEGFIALDARVILHPATMRDAELPRPAIRPYPSSHFELANSRWHQLYAAANPAR